MKYTEAKQGRTFILRLEDGDVVHEVIEDFAKTHAIKSAFLQIVGGIDQNSTLIVGPKDGRSKTIVPMTHQLSNVYEVTGTGTLFPDENGQPVLHMHVACGRNDQTITGCIRHGIKTWHIIEIILIELTECSAIRKMDTTIGFKLLHV